MQINFFNTLPIENQLEIFFRFDEKTCGRSSQVCKAWEKICSMDEIWKHIFPGIEKITNSKYKAYIKQFNLGKIEHLFEIKPKFESFCARLENVQRGVFNCLFPHNPGCLAIFQLGSQDEALPCYQELYLCTTPLDNPQYRITQTSSSSYNYRSSFNFPGSYKGAFKLHLELDKMGRNKSDSM